MMRALLGSVAVLAGVLLLAGPASAEKKKLEARILFQGSVEDEKLQAKGPANGVITTQKGLDDLIAAWKLPEKKVEVDFKKELVVLTTTVGSRLSLFATLDTDKGNLDVGGIATRDLRPGFRYIVAAVPSEGVKTVNGKDLPK